MDREQNPLHLTKQQKIDNVLGALSQALNDSLLEKEIPDCIDWAVNDIEYQVKSGLFTPYGYQRCLFHDWSNPNTPKDHTIKGAQLGFSDCFQIFKFWEVTQRKRDLSYYLHRDKDLTRYSVAKQSRAYQKNPALVDLLEAGDTKRAPNNNNYLRVYKGGAIEYMFSAQSSANFVDYTCDTVCNDELDKQPFDVEGDGTPDDNAYGRTAGSSTFRKGITISTPGKINPLTGETNTTRCIKTCDQYVTRHLQCPNNACKNWAPLYWGGPDSPGGFKFQLVPNEDGTGIDIEKSVKTIYHKCAKCGYKMEYLESHYVDDYHGRYQSEDAYKLDDDSTMYSLETGRIIPDPYALGRHVPQFYSRTVTWEDQLRSFFKAKDALKQRQDPGPMKQWVNEGKGEAYKPVSAKRIVNWSILKGRAETYEAECPDGVQYITSAIDLHEGGEATKPFVAAEIIGWGWGMENWSLDYINEIGDPLTTNVVDRVIQRIYGRSFKQKNGRLMYVSLCCIDTGWQPKIAYAWEATNPDFFIPIRGQTKPGQPICSGRDKKPNKHNARICWIGGDTATDQIYAGFAGVTVPGPGFSHFKDRATMPRAENYSDDYFKGQVSEKKAENGKYEKISTHIRNEPLDLRKYNMCGMHLLMMEYGRVFTPPGMSGTEEAQESLEQMSITNRVGAGIVSPTQAKIMANNPANEGKGAGSLRNRRRNRNQPVQFRRQQ